MADSPYAITAEMVLRDLLVACEAANSAATERLGGIVIDISDLAPARLLLRNEVAFCGGWPNVLKASWPSPLAPPPALSWAEPNPTQEGS